jgi:hypothetical protein
MNTEYVKLKNSEDRSTYIKKFPVEECVKTNRMIYNYNIELLDVGKSFMCMQFNGIEPPLVRKR